MCGWATVVLIEVNLNCVMHCVMVNWVIIGSVMLIYWNSDAANFEFLVLIS